MKVCIKCHIEKPYSDYHLKSSAKDGYSGVCKTCKSEYAKQKYRQDPSIKDRTKVTSRTYTAKRLGLSKDDLVKFYLAQNSKCAICGIPEKEHGKFLAIDHNHTTGKVRGLLCMACNTGLGNFKDSIENLEKAISYLRDND